MKNFLKQAVGRVLQFFFSFFPISPQKIFFETGTGEVKDHPKVFYDYLKANRLDEFIIRWAVNPHVDVSSLEKSEIVHKRTFNYYYQLMTSHYWIRTHSIESVFHKRPHQIYIQLWHGPGAIKKQGYDVQGTLNSQKTMPHAREWDYFIATDPYSKKYIQTALNLHIPRLLLGSCRSDALVNAKPEQRDYIRDKLGIRSSEQAILYAPTFREYDFKKETVDLPIKKLCHLPNVRVILRVHPEIRHKLKLEEYGEQVIDGHIMTDIFDLYLASDVLLTDYSSLSVEYMLLGKPIIYYMYDLESYLQERDFYADYLSCLAGPLVKSEKALISAVKTIKEVAQSYQTKYRYLNHIYNQGNDGHVCERFYELLSSGFFAQKEQWQLPKTMKGGWQDCDTQYI